MQFVGNKEYIIGNCENGIDFRTRKKLIEQSGKEYKICRKCAINKRCKHTCACRNYMTTKNINGLSPIVCELEKIIIENVIIWQKNCIKIIRSYLCKNCTTKIIIY